MNTRFTLRALFHCPPTVSQEVTPEAASGAVKGKEAANTFGLSEVTGSRKEARSAATGTPVYSPSQRWGCYRDVLRCVPSIYSNSYRLSEQWNSLCDSRVVVWSFERSSETDGRLERVEPVVIWANGDTWTSTPLLLLRLAVFPSLCSFISNAPTWLL